MSGSIIILACVALAIVVACVGAWIVPRYNRLLALRLDIDRAWWEIDQLLTWRHDEIQRLAATIEAVGGEPDVATGISARFVAIAPWLTPPDRYVAEQRINASASKLLNLISYHPNLKRNPRFIELKQRIKVLDEQIQAHRERYNALVTSGNACFDRMPDRWLAGYAGLRPRPSLSAPEDERSAASVQRAGGTNRARTTDRFPGRGWPDRRLDWTPPSPSRLRPDSTAVRLLP